MTATSPLSATQVSAASVIGRTRVYVDNRGHLTVEGDAKISAQTYRSLLARRVVRVNGASRAVINGRSVRRVVLSS